MAGKIFPSGMDPRAGLKLADFLLIGNSDTEAHEIATLQELAALLSSGLRKDGYRWVKGAGKTDLDEYDDTDEIIGVGSLFPGYLVHGYVNTKPMTDPNTHITILSSVPI